MYVFIVCNCFKTANSMIRLYTTVDTSWFTDEDTRDNLLCKPQTSIYYFNCDMGTDVDEH